FGRAWRRKAPVESLMPLRLARYGVPLAETAPAGLAAAGIEPALLPPAPTPALAPVQAAAPAAPGSSSASNAPQSSAPTAGHVSETDGAGERPALPVPARKEITADTRYPPHQHRKATGPRIEANGVFAKAYRTWLGHFQTEPTPLQFAAFLQNQYAITTATGHPLSDKQLHPILRSLQKRYATPTTPATPQNPSTTPAESTADDLEREEFVYRARQDYGQEHSRYPDAEQLATHVFQRDGITTAKGQPLTGAGIDPFIAAFRRRDLNDAVPDPTDPSDPADTRVSLPVQTGPRDEEAEKAEDNATNDGLKERGPLTTVDRYYLAWRDYQAQYGQEPKDHQLSTFLAEKHGVLGRGGQNISPSTLRRYLPGFRLYTAWSALREHTETPTAHDVARECATREITLRKTPVTTEMIEPDLPSFERRWQAIRTEQEL
ncbi:hypothetical protein ACFWI3_41970, partial [Streptomyces sp. NPDC127066]